MRERLIAAVLCLASAAVLVMAAQSTSWWRADKKTLDIGFGLGDAYVCSEGNECRTWSYDQFTRGENKGVPFRFTLTRILLFCVAGLALAVAATTLVTADKVRAHLGRSLIGAALITGGVAYWSVSLFDVYWLAPAGKMGWAFPGTVVALLLGLGGSHLAGRRADRGD